MPDVCGGRRRNHRSAHHWNRLVSFLNRMTGSTVACCRDSHGKRDRPGYSIHAGPFLTPVFSVKLLYGGQPLSPGALPSAQRGLLSSRHPSWPPADSLPPKAELPAVSVLFPLLPWKFPIELPPGRMPPIRLLPHKPWLPTGSAESPWSSRTKICL